MAALAILWIVASFATTVGAHTPIQPTSGAYTPEVRTFLALLAFGGCVLWPVGRITLTAGAFGARRAALDAVTLLVLLQAIFWPTHLVTSWSLERALAIDALLCGWACCAGACVALATQGQRPRATWAIAVAEAAVAGALLDAAGVAAPVPELLGPFAALVALAPLGAGGSANVPWALAAWPWALAAACWALALRGRPGAAAVAPGNAFR